MSPVWSAPQPLDFIPAGKLVTFTAMHQSSATQYVQIIDQSQRPIQFTRLDGSTATFPISGSGAEVGFLANGAGSFIMANGLQIQFASSNGFAPQVAAAAPSDFYINEKHYGGGIMFVTEDGYDNDFNDTSFVLQWYLRMG
jgi:hypothetical protein